MFEPFDFLNFADRVTVTTTAGPLELKQDAHGGGWSTTGLSARLHGADETNADIEESADPIFHVTIEWSKAGEHLRVLGDAWERAYGDLEWRNSNQGELICPWYFLATYSGGSEPQDHWIIG